MLITVSKIFDRQLGIFSFNISEPDQLRRSFLVGPVQVAQGFAGLQDPHPPPWAVGRLALQAGFVVVEVTAVIVIA